MSEVVPTRSMRASTWQTSPAWTEPVQTQSSIALKNTVCPGATARVATTQANHLGVMHGGHMMSWMDMAAWAGMTRIEST